MVYMSTLLFNIGEIAFWSLTGKSGRLISDLLKHSGVKDEQAEKNILGVTFRELSLGLAAEWRLSDLLKRALQQPSSDDVNIKCISYGNQIAEQIISEHCDLNSIAEKIAHGNEYTTAQIKSMILENMEIGRETYSYYKK